MGRVKDLIARDMETPITDQCPECEGDGHIEYDVPRPQSFTRDVGYIDTMREVCPTCCGDGEITRVCSNCDYPVTFGMGHDAEYCEECSS